MIKTLPNPATDLLNRVCSCLYFEKKVGHFKSEKDKARRDRLRAELDEFVAKASVFPYKKIDLNYIFIINDL